MPGMPTMAPPIFVRSFNPISTRGADFAHHITTSIPNIFHLPALLEKGPIISILNPGLLNSEVLKNLPNDAKLKDFGKGCEITFKILPLMQIQKPQ